MTERTVLPPEWALDFVYVDRSIQHQRGPSMRDRVFWTIPWRRQSGSWSFVWAIRVDWAMRRARERGALEQKACHALVRWEDAKPEIIYLSKLPSTNDRPSTSP